ncbi:Mlp family lipoprotein [Borrelia puertoricensis]|uniref:Mlp family lipoprotein n=1 Tax=Borrelia puertoricensis TaxID=2756107 RepID=UPI001FF4E34A|nr:Mlp family lipoprotein [Borrelia puertoricensis]
MPSWTNPKETFQNFVIWVSSDIRKQKELTLAFTDAYNFLDEKRQQYKVQYDFKQYLEDGILTNMHDHGDGKYGISTQVDIKNKEIQGIYPNDVCIIKTNLILSFFKNILEDISTASESITTHEEMLTIMINIIRNETNLLKKEWSKETN